MVLSMLSLPFTVEIEPVLFLLNSTILPENVSHCYPAS